ncbi:butirosin biosynthesis protein H-like [Allonocardiopsis opalescens]|uniref:Butirosin biosynthesis protein H-like n=1 Tax=Allonocardiopsis opalescens TaxID=1144618 RepID=A0A2T0PY86_9ACTN|nr:butirosin biosynthesis protein H-like [Allonocardiopsis opalescens]
MRQWYRDPLSCLQTTLATLLLRAGEDPLGALGLAWEFVYPPGEVHAVEYYWPCRHPGDLARSVLPHHSVTSAWRRAGDADPLGELERALERGVLPIAAVDNFHLPFRPAYQDVHAAHLVVVYDVDRGRGEVGVSDVMPPDHLGPVAAADFLRAWYSPMPHDEQDAFFSGSPTAGGRWLEVHMRTPFPALTPGRLAAALRADSALLTGPDDDGGLRGLRRYTAELVERAETGDGDAVGRVYTFGWAPQAQASLHGELLRRQGAAWGLPDLAEAGRRVEGVAHAWTSLRVAGAHGRRRPRACAPQLKRHAARLDRRYHEAVEAVGLAIDALQPEAMGAVDG